MNCLHGAPSLYFHSLFTYTLLFTCCYSHSFFFTVFMAYTYSSYGSNTLDLQHLMDHHFPTGTDDEFIHPDDALFEQLLDRGTDLLRRSGVRPRNHLLIRRGGLRSTCHKEVLSQHQTRSRGSVTRAVYTTEDLNSELFTIQEALVILTLRHRATDYLGQDCVYVVRLYEFYE